MRLRTVPTWHDGGSSAQLVGNVAELMAEPVVVFVVVRTMLIRGNEAGKEVNRNGVPSLLPLLLLV